MPVRRPPHVGVARVAAVLGATGAGLVLGLIGAGPALALGLPTPGPLPIALPTALPQPASPSPSPTTPTVPNPVATPISMLGGPTAAPAPGTARPGGTTKSAPTPAPRPAAKGAAPVGVRSTPGSGGTAASGTLPSGLSGNPLLATGGFPSQLSGQATLGDLLSPMLAGPAPEQVAAPDLAAPLVGVASAVGGGHRGSTDPARSTTVVVIAVVALASVSGAHLVRFRRARAGSPAEPATP